MPKVKKSSKTTIKLTEEQVKQISKAFGPKFAKRIQGLEVDQIEGFMRANMKVN